MSLHKGDIYQGRRFVGDNPNDPSAWQDVDPVTVSPTPQSVLDGGGYRGAQSVAGLTSGGGSDIAQLGSTPQSSDQSLADMPAPTIDSLTGGRGRSLRLGDIVNGQRYIGGNPNEGSAWENARLTDLQRGTIDPAVNVFRKSYIPGAAETLGTMVSAIPATIVGGLAGLGEVGIEVWNGEPIDKATQSGVDTIRRVQSALTYTPKTIEGQQVAGALGAVAAPIGRIFSHGTEAATSGWGSLGALVGPRTERALAALGSVSVPYLSLMMGGADKPKLDPNNLTATQMVDPKNWATFSRPEGWSPTAERALQIAADRAKEISTGALLKSTGGIQYADDAYPAGLANISAEGETQVASPSSPGYGTHEEQTARLRQLVIDASKGDTKAVLEVADLDPQIIADAKAVGLEIGPDVASRSAAFRDLYAARKSMDPTLVQKESAYGPSMNALADQLITDMGGQTDRSIFDPKLKLQVDMVDDGLRTVAGELYDRVAMAVPAKTVAPMSSSRAYIAQLTDDSLGRVDTFKGLNKDLYDLVKNGPVSYRVLDSFRKSIGEAYDHVGSYSGTAKGELDQTYALLAKDQMEAASSISPAIADDLAQANIIASQYLSLHEQAVGLLGRDISKSVNPRITLSANDLIKGNVTTFDNALELLPKNLHGEFSAQVLSQIMTSGSKSAETSGGFATAYTQLTRNRGALDRLLSELPAEAGPRFDRLGRLSQAIQRGMARNNMSRSARDVLVGLDVPGKLEKIFDAAKAAPVVGGPLKVAEATGKFFNVSPIRRVTATQSANKFFDSTQFSRAIEDYAAGGNAEAANAAVYKIPEFRLWMAEVDPVAARDIANVGFIGWLFNPQAQAEAPQKPLAGIGTMENPLVPKSVEELDRIPSGMRYRDFITGSIHLKQ